MALICIEELSLTFDIGTYGWQNYSTNTGYILKHASGTGDLQKGFLQSLELRASFSFSSNDVVKQFLQEVLKPLHTILFSFISW